MTSSLRLFEGFNRRGDSYQVNKNIFKWRWRKKSRLNFFFLKFQQMKSHIMILLFIIMIKMALFIFLKTKWMLFCLLLIRAHLHWERRESDMMMTRLYVRAYISITGIQSPQFLPHPNDTSLPPPKNST